MIAAGSVLTVTGIGVAAAPNDYETRDGWFGGTYQSEDHSSDITGGLMVVTGVVLLIAGLAARDEHAEPRMVTAYPAYVPMPMYAAPPTQTIVDAPNAQTVIVADTVIVENAPANAALMSKVANRLAIQASVTAKAGHCEAALLTARKLAEVDLDLYEKLLVTDEAIARCSTL